MKIILIFSLICLLLLSIWLPFLKRPQIDVGYKPVNANKNIFSLRFNIVLFQYSYHFILSLGSPAQLILSRKFSWSQTFAIFMVWFRNPAWSWKYLFQYLHSCMPSPLARDPIRVQSCVCCLFWTNSMAV